MSEDSGGKADQPRNRGQRRGDSSSFAMSRQVAHYATVGIMFPVAIGLGFFLGYLIDRRLGTVPLFALLGLGLGVVAAIRNLLRTVASDRNV